MLIEEEPEYVDDDMDNDGPEYKLFLVRRDNVRSLGRVNKSWRSALRKCLIRNPKYRSELGLLCIEDIPSEPTLWDDYFDSQFTDALEYAFCHIRYLRTYHNYETTYESIGIFRMGHYWCSFDENDRTVSLLFSLDFVPAGFYDPIIGSCLFEVISTLNNDKRVIVKRGNSRHTPSITTANFIRLCNIIESVIYDECLQILQEKSRMNSFTRA